MKLAFSTVLLTVLSVSRLFSQTVPVSSVPGLAANLPPASACAGKTSLACAIPNLYGPYGLVLPIADRSSHFLASYQENFMALNSEIATQLTLLPLASPAS